MESIFDTIVRVVAPMQVAAGEEALATAAINEAVVAASPSGCSVGSVLVGDRCYNRHNDGGSVKLTDPKLFLHVRHGFYKYVGASYPYTGPVFQKPRGSKEVVVVAERLNGQLVSNTSCTA